MFEVSFCVIENNSIGATTGEHSIYRKFNNNEIMFHVSTMLPYNPKDKQQLERKR